jgi:hypothetical protein
LTFPYCNQGAGAIDLSEKVDTNTIMANASKRLGLSEETIKSILQKISKQNNQ